MLMTALMVAATVQAMAGVYAPLQLYDGGWRATRDGKTTTILNHCRRTGRFFVCEQTVNGAPKALVIFVPLGGNRYATQGVNSDGFALGRGDLQIDGEHWTYSSKGVEKGKTMFYRTTNAFHGPDRIHFELLQSTDGKQWTVTSKGDEVRMPDARKAADLQGIAALHAEDVRATLSGDPSELAKLWTSDAVRMEPGGPPEVGKATIVANDRKEAEKHPATKTQSYKPQIGDLQIIGDTAIEWGTFDSSWIASPTAQPQKLEGKFLRVLARQPDGSWRFSRVIWTYAQ